MKGNFLFAGSWLPVWWQARRSLVEGRERGIKVLQRHRRLGTVASPETVKNADVVEEKEGKSRTLTEQRRNENRRNIHCEIAAHSMERSVL